MKNLFFVKNGATYCAFQFTQKTGNLQICYHEKAFFRQEKRGFVKNGITYCAFQFTQKTGNLQICYHEKAFFRQEKRVFVKNGDTYCAFQFTQKTVDATKCDFVEEIGTLAGKNFTILKQAIKDQHEHEMQNRYASKKDFEDDLGVLNAT